MSSDGIQFGGYCFKYTYSVQSTSSFSDSLSSLDALSLEYFFSFRKAIPSPSSTVIRKNAELKSLSTDAEDVWIENYAIKGLTSLVFNGQRAMRNLTIGVYALNGVTLFELSDLEMLERVVIMKRAFITEAGQFRISNCTKLKTIDIGESAFYHYDSFTLSNLPQLQSIQLSYHAVQKVHSIVLDGNWYQELNT